MSQDLPDLTRTSNLDDEADFAAIASLDPLNLPGDYYPPRVLTNDTLISNPQAQIQNGQFPDQTFNFQLQNSHNDTVSEFQRFGEGEGEGYKLISNSQSMPPTCDPLDTILNLPYTPTDNRYPHQLAVPGHTHAQSPYRAEYESGDTCFQPLDDPTLLEFRDASEDLMAKLPLTEFRKLPLQMSIGTQGLPSKNDSQSDQHMDAGHYRFDQYHTVGVEHPSTYHFGRFRLSEPGQKGETHSASNLPNGETILEVSGIGTKKTEEGDSNTNFHGLTQDEIKDLREFSNFFLDIRNWDDPLLRKLAKSRGRHKSRSLLSAIVKEEHDTGSKNLRKMIVGLCEGNLDRWPASITNNDFYRYLTSLKSYDSKRSGMVDRVQGIVDKTCDLEIRKFIYPNLNHSKRQSGKGKMRLTVYSETSSIYSELSNTPFEKRDKVYFRKLPHHMQRNSPRNPSMSGNPQKDSDTIENLLATSLTLSKIAIKRPVDVPMNSHVVKSIMYSTLDGIAIMRPRLQQQVDDMKSKIRETPFRAKSGKIY